MARWPAFLNLGENKIWSIGKVSEPLTVPRPWSEIGRMTKEAARWSLRPFDSDLQYLPKIWPKPIGTENKHYKNLKRPILFSTTHYWLDSSRNGSYLAASGYRTIILEDPVSSEGSFCPDNLSDLSGLHQPNAQKKKFCLDCWIWPVFLTNFPSKFGTADTSIDLFLHKGLIGELETNSNWSWPSNCCKSVPWNFVIASSLGFILLISNSDHHLKIP